MIFPRIGQSTLLMLVGAFYCLMATNSSAQLFQNRRMQPEGMLLAAPREIEVLLEDAKAAIGRKQWSEATMSLGMILGIEEGQSNDLIGEDYFLIKDEFDSQTILGSVFRRAREIIESMPAEGKKIVELRYGVFAAQQLEKAIEASDWKLMQDVSGKYGFTTAGQDATLILAERALSLGETRRAALLFNRLLNQATALERFGPPLGIMTAAAFQSANMSQQALSALTTTRKQFANGKLDWKGINIAWQDSTTGASILELLTFKDSVAMPRVVKQPSYFGGNSTRNAESTAGAPLPFLWWHAELHESLQHKDNLEEAFKRQLAEGKSTLIPSRYPISVDNWIITPTYDQRIVAIDIQTGRLGFPYVYSGMPLGFSMDRFATRDITSSRVTAPDYLAKRVWGETAAGQISSDGKRIFIISELPSVDVAESFARGPNARVARMTGPRTYNVLQCLSIADQGKLLWEVGGPAGESETQLAGVLFLGTPLPYGDELLAMCEVNGEVFLVSMSPQTGKMLWRQPLATNQSAIALDNIRRNVGLTPAVDGSIVLCPTLTGFLIAYDMASRELLWSYKYPVLSTSNSQNSVNFMGTMEMGEFNPFQPRTAETSVTLHDGVVLFAPPNGNGVAAISLATGKSLWKIEDQAIPGRDPSQIRYVAGAWDGKAFIVSSNSMIAVDLKSGRDAWPLLTLPNQAQVVGRGVRNQGMYYLPTSSQEILQIDLSQGKIVESVRVERPLGNLIASGDKLISASPYELSCYRIREATRSQAVEELKRDSLSPTGLELQGELSLAAGDIEKSLDYFERAYKIDPDNSEIQLKLMKAGATALNKDFDRFVDRVSKYEKFALNLDHSFYLRILIHGLERQGRYAEMLSKLLELSDNRTGRRIDQMTGSDFIEQTGQWSVQEDRWIATKIARCYEQMSQSDRQRMAPAIQDRVDTVIAKKFKNKRRLRFEHLQSLPQSEVLRLETVADSENQELSIAEHLLLQDGLLETLPRDSELSKSRREALARIYLKARRFLMAFEYVDRDLDAIKQLRESMTAPSSPFEPRAFRFDNFEQILSNRMEQPAAHAWPTGKVEVKTDSQIRLPSLTPYDPLVDVSTSCVWQEIIGNSLRGWELRYSSNGFQFIDPTSMEQFRLMIDTGSLEKPTLPKPYAVDSVVLIELNQQLIAIDTLRASMSEQDGQLWRQSFGDEMSTLERGRVQSSSVDRNTWGLPTTKRTFRVAAVSRHGVVVQNDDELICLDLFTGSKMWSATGYRGAMFSKSGNTLFAFRGTRSGPNDKSSNGGATAGQEQILHIDMRDGSVVKTVDLGKEFENWSPISAVGVNWLFAPKDNESRTLRLVDAMSGTIKLERAHTVDTRLALVDDKGLVAMRLTGEMFYWNFATGKEYPYTVDVEGKFTLISAQSFGDTVLIMPHSSDMELGKGVSVDPRRNNAGYVPCAGRMFAIAPDDGRPLWARSQRVKHFSFPLHQNRNLPAAFFVRKLTLNKIRGKSIDLMSMAMFDVKTGRLLYQRHNFPARRGDGFRQQIFESANVVTVDYLGNHLEATWTDDKEGLVSEDAVEEIGDLDVATFKKEIENELDTMNSAPPTPSSGPQPLDPAPE